MDPDQVKKLIKRVLVVGVFFLIALGIFFLPDIVGLPASVARALLIAYVVITAVLLVCAILLQSGKGGGLASIGGMSGDALLGTRSATPIAKATYVLGGLFLFLCLLLAKMPPPEPPAEGVVTGGDTAETAGDVPGAGAPGPAGPGGAAEGGQEPFAP
jgi:protein translocase SecG subunit